MKVFFSVGGWMYFINFVFVVLILVLWVCFVDFVVCFFVDLGFDGLDIDWEYFVSFGEVVNYVFFFQVVWFVFNFYFVIYVSNYYFFFIIVSLVGLIYYNIMQL